MNLGAISIEKAFYTAFAFLLSLVAPYIGMIVSVFVFVILDLVTGVWAAKKEGQKLKSGRLKNTIMKAGFYIVSIACAATLDGHIGASGTLSIANGFCVLILGNEFYSILENMYRITGQRLFYILTQFTLGRIKNATGQDLTKNGVEKNENNHE